MSGYSRWMEKSFNTGTLTFPPEHRGVAVVTGPTGNSQNATVGQVLTATTGNWTNSPTSYAYQWVRGYVPWTNIGTNSASYTLVAGDSGNVVRCVVSAVNSAGTTVGPPSDLMRVA